MWLVVTVTFKFNHFNKLLRLPVHLLHHHLPTKEEVVVRYHKMMSKDNQCCLCNFRISDPSPEEGQLCGLLTSMWDHIEECHPEEEDWFDETFSSMFLDV